MQPVCISCIAKKSSENKLFWCHVWLELIGVQKTNHGCWLSILNVSICKFIHSRGDFVLGYGLVFVLSGHFLLELDGQHHFQCPLLEMFSFGLVYA